MLLCAREHNRHHSCVESWAKYCRAQKASAAAPPPVPVGAEDAHAVCTLPVPKKKQKRVEVTCMPSNAAASLQLTVPEAVPPPPTLEEPSRLTVAAPDDLVVVNISSHTVHAVSHISPIESQCGWRFQFSAKRPRRAHQLRDPNLFACGTCFGHRVPFFR